MPLYVEEILNIEDPTNKRRLEPMSEEEKDYYWPGTTTGGTPYAYYPIGNYATQVHPDGNTLSFVSSNSSDNGQLRISGFVSSVLKSELITINGITPVVSTNSYTKMESIVKVDSSATTLTGDLTVTENGSSSTIAVIPYWVKNPSYQWIALHYIPSSAITYTVRAEMYKPDMIHDFDWPAVPEPYHDIILLDALTEVLPVWGKPEEAIYYERKYSRRMKEMRSGHDRRGTQNVKQFENVTTGTRAYPNRPLVRGIDFI